MFSCSQEIYIRINSKTGLNWPVFLVFILFENLFKPRQRRLAVDMITDFVSLIYNLKTVF
ncbi:hypothetical protein AZJ21_09465 [Streptococcus pneumoniae]|nr:hypothetical protein AZJ88_09605 [Streptococcus pneumoniae]TVW73746.1 hypothetical protein AZJ69_09970 [Streptococcus pneumoniae]TVX01996.1 hypothetical protein AZJ57_08390 [Streptococcus pneumoniae]TVX61278.1 hypothetical protein AZJ27_07030 [Streptococcus pneumoniae]TVX75837.1 hypothetical protein AZJ21_09465 [Streptococcus pneumoniae]